VQPFDSLLERVYITMLDLDSAVAEVERGLQVLDHGLDSVESDVYNGRLQLYGTGKVLTAMHLQRLSCDYTAWFPLFLRTFKHLSKTNLQWFEDRPHTLRLQVHKRR